MNLSEEDIVFFVDLLNLNCLLDLNDVSVMVVLCDKVFGGIFVELDDFSSFVGFMLKLSVVLLIFVLV